MSQSKFITLGFFFLLGLFGCDLPSPLPDLLYKFDVMSVGKGPAYLLTHDLNLDGELDLVSVN